MMPDTNMVSKKYLDDNNDDDDDFFLSEQTVCSVCKFTVVCGEKKSESNGFNHFS
jgi:hypothetical protein